MQLDHVWSLKRFLADEAAREGIQAIDRLNLHLDAIRSATAEHEEIATTVADTQAECLRFVFARQRGEDSALTRAGVMDALDRLQDRILAYPAVIFGRRQ